jgi:hypothetical protein
MSVASNTSGSFQRTTNVPAPSNFTACFWARWDATSLSGNFFQSMFGLDGGSYLQMGSNGGADTELHLYCGVGASNTVIHDPADAWFFYGLVGSATNVCTVYYRATTANALTSVACGGGSATATGIYFFQDSNGSGQRADRAQGLAFKAWDAQLTAAELMAESYFIQPQRRANINTFVPFYGAGGTDESGLGRNLTVNGTPIATGATPPVKSRRSAAKVFLPSGATSITGTLAATIDAVTSSASGSVAVAGSGSPTIGAVTSSADGDVAVAGALAQSIGPVSSSAAGVVPVAGASAQTIGNVTSTADGDVVVTGQGSPTIGNVTLSATGGSGTLGDLAQTIAPVTAAAVGAVAVAGTSGAAIDPVSSSAAGAVAVQGGAAASVGTVSASSTGAVQVAGSLGADMGQLTLEASGLSGSGPPETPAATRAASSTADKRRRTAASGARR